MLLVLVGSACESARSPSTGTTSAAGTPAQQSGPQPSLDDQAHLRAAVLIASCVPDDGVARTLAAMLYEVDAPGDFYDAILEQAPACLAQRSDGCAGVEACTGVISDLKGYCEPSCTGDVFEACNDALRFRMDCAVLGMTCSLEAGCTPRDAAAPVPCSYDDFTPGCVENRPRVCLGDDVRLGVECPFGTTCAVGSGDSDALCRGGGAACTMDSYSPMGVDAGPGLRCIDESTLELCVGFKTHALDCEQVQPGFSCRTHGDTAFCGLADECDPFETAATCDGSTLVACNAGRFDRIECTSLGFTGCAANRRGALCDPIPP